MLPFSIVFGEQQNGGHTAQCDGHTSLASAAPLSTTVSSGTVIPVVAVLALVEVILISVGTVIVGERMVVGNS